MANSSATATPTAAANTASDTDEADMNKLCRQVSIESPGALFKNCVFSFIVPIPDTPATGARIKIVCAGACYRRHRTASVSSVSSGTSEVGGDLPIIVPSTGAGGNGGISGGGIGGQSSTVSPAPHGVRNGSLFPGFEVAGVIDVLGDELQSTAFYVGQRVVIYPFDDLPDGYADYIVVPDMKYVIPIPDELPLSVAAMLPTGALLAMNTVYTAHEICNNLLRQRTAAGNNDCKILIVGTGGLALWAVRIAAYYFTLSACKPHVHITVASLRDEGFRLAKDIEEVNVVQWSEDLFEEHLIERTMDACGGPVDVVIDFCTTSRSLHRSLQCLEKGGVVLISDDTAEKLLPRFSKRAEERDQEIKAVANGTIDQLKDLVNLVATHQIDPPPHSVFPCEEASEVVRKLCISEIPGRAILRFEDID